VRKNAGIAFLGGSQSRTVSEVVQAKAAGQSSAISARKIRPLKDMYQILALKGAGSLKSRESSLVANASGQLESRSVGMSKLSNFNKLQKVRE